MYHVDFFSFVSKFTIVLNNLLDNFLYIKAIGRFYLLKRLRIFLQQAYKLCLFELVFDNLRDCFKVLPGAHNIVAH